MLTFSSVLIVVLGTITSFTLVLLLRRAFQMGDPVQGNVVHSIPSPTDNSSSRLPTLNHTLLHVRKTDAVVIPRQRVVQRTCNGHTFNVSESNVFLQAAYCQIQHHGDIVQFSGPRISQLFDTGNRALHVYTGHDMKARHWGDIADLISTVGKQQGVDQANHTDAPKAVHVHNYHKLGDFMLLFRDEYFRGGPDRKTMVAGGPSAVPLNQEQFTWAIDKGQPPIVLTNWGDENWGAFSGAVNTRTAKWFNMTNHLRIHYSDFNTVRMLLDSPKVVLVVTNTHVEPRIGNHSKLICVPLGMKAREAMYSKAQQLLHMKYNKTTLLRINNSGWGDRTAINAQVSAAFNHTVKNSYSRTSRVDHHLETAKAKFVLCPSGLGFDTYRLWETLLMGSIPIVESNAGFDRTYSNLPVLVVRNYSDVTPTLLQRAYPCFLRHAQDYNYAHLTESYWLELVRTAVRTGTVDHVTQQHPFRNKYCDFL